MSLIKRIRTGLFGHKTTEVYTPEYVDVSAEGLRRHHDRRWAELDEDQRLRIVWATEGMLKDVTNINELINTVTGDPDWGSHYHFGWGMAVRNYLRDQGIKDEDLPTRNLDDYWVKAVEVAVARWKQMRMENVPE